MFWRLKQRKINKLRDKYRVIKAKKQYLERQLCGMQEYSGYYLDQCVEMEAQLVTIRLKLVNLGDTLVNML